MLQFIQKGTGRQKLTGSGTLGEVPADDDQIGVKRLQIFEQGFHDHRNIPAKVQI
jgi:hypothetical protein